MASVQPGPQLTPPPGSTIVLGEYGQYRLSFEGTRKPVYFMANNDDEALRDMCNRLCIAFPPDFLTFKAKGGKELSRVRPYQKIYPPEPPISRPGILQFFIGAGRSRKKKGVV